MASPQSALRRSELGIHAQSEICPLCDQTIPNEKVNEVHARMEAQERRLAEAANALATRQIASEKARIEAAANATLERLRNEHAEALRRATADIAAKLEAARSEARKAAEAALQERIAAAEKSRAEAETAAAQKVAAAQQAVSARDAAWQEKIAAAGTEKQQALAQLAALKANQDLLVTERVLEVREVLEKDKADALAVARAAHDAETRKLTAHLETLQRQLEKQRADELGEGAEVKLFDALKAEFPGDDIRRVQKGISGADILHTVIQNGRACGTIIYDSKNSTAWRDDYVSKLIRDQTAAKADHAILSTFKFPSGTSQVAVRGSVIIVNPARAIALARIVRRHLTLVHTLRLSKAERTKKMAALYDFITSERCALLLGRIDSETESLLELQAGEIKAHENHWKKEGLHLRSIQKVKAELETEIDSIIGADDPVD
jgi:hypothetical protein